MTGAALIGGAVSGAVMGSAAGAALDRWPTGGTLRSPRRSHCSTCRAVLRSRDLIPVLSWLMLRGRCRSCASTIDARLPLLEVASGAGVALTLHAHGIRWQSALLAIGVIAVLLATLTDLEGMIVPDRLTLPFGVLAVAGMGVLAADGAAQRSLFVWALGVPAALHVASRTAERIASGRPLGGGDVKLLIGVLALASAVDGGPAAVLMLAVLGAGSVAMLGLATGRLSRGDRIPFAPAIAGGYLTVVLVPAAAPAVVGLLGGVA
jgi:leader peptidase (prepilin peptidase) / N-methyltransferase